MRKLLLPGLPRTASQQLGFPPRALARRNRSSIMEPNGRGKNSRVELVKQGSLSRFGFRNELLAQKNNDGQRCLIGRCPLTRACAESRPAHSDSLFPTILHHDVSTFRESHSYLKIDLFTRFRALEEIMNRRLYPSRPQLSSERCSLFIRRPRIPRPVARLSRRSALSQEWMQALRFCPAPRICSRNLKQSAGVTLSGPDSQHAI